MAKVGWEGIEVLDNQAKQETKNEQLEIDKSYARTFETEEGKKCLKHLMKELLQMNQLNLINHKRKYLI